MAIAAAGVLAGGGGLAALLARAGASITGVNQLWDAAWHANLTRLIAQSGDGRPAVAGTLIGAGWREVDSWYPTGLHVAAALVTRTGGTPAGVVPVAAALGAVVALQVLVVLPVAVAALVWELAGDLPRRGGARMDSRARGAGAAVGAVLATLPTAFPLDRVWRPAWPMSVGFVLGLVTVLALVRCARAVREGAMTAPAAGCVVASCLIGTALTHPSGAVVAVLVGAAWLTGRAAALRGRVRWRALGAVAAGVALAAAGTIFARDHVVSVASVFSYDYRHGDLGAAAASVAGLSAPMAPGSGYGVPREGGQPLVGALLLAGALGCAALRGARWLAVLWGLAVLAALETFVHIAAPLALITGWFFNVEARLVALLALVGALAAGVAVAAGSARTALWCSGLGRAVVLSATAGLARRGPVAAPAPGVRAIPERATAHLVLTAAPGLARAPDPLLPDLFLADLASPDGWSGSASWPHPAGGSRAVRTGDERRRLTARRTAAGSLAVVVVAALAAVALSSAQRAVPRVGAAYADRVVGPDAAAVMTALAAAPLPPGGRVLNDPLDGSPWLYALTGTMPMFTHYEDYDPTGDAALLLAGLNEVDDDPGVRAALERMRVCYVYAGDALVSASKQRPAGFEDLDDVAALRPITRSGGAVAYKVVPPPAGCAGGPAR